MLTVEKPLTEPRGLRGHKGSWAVTSTLGLCPPNPASRWKTPAAVCKLYFTQLQNNLYVLPVFLF